MTLSKFLACPEFTIAIAFLTIRSLLRNTLKNLGPIDSALIVLSYLKARANAKLNPDIEAENFEEWVTERFGSRLYRTFF